VARPRDAADGGRDGRTATADLQCRDQPAAPDDLDAACDRLDSAAPGIGAEHLGRRRLAVGGDRGAQSHPAQYGRAVGWGGPRHGYHGVDQRRCQQRAQLCDGPAPVGYLEHATQRGIGEDGGGPWWR
jgi:hypothetical protein